MACKLFWVSYFALQRGQQDEGLKTLWNEVRTRLDYRTILRASLSDILLEDLELYFKEEHDKLLNGLEKKFAKHADAWIESSAGKAFTEYVVRRK